MKNIVITGYSGSIGTKLVELLSKENYIIKWDVRKEKFPTAQCDVIIFLHGGFGNSFEETFNKNVRFISEELPNLLKNNLIPNNSQIILFTSRRAIRPSERSWDYSAAKAACHAYVLALYRAYPKLKITAISPGWVESKMAAEHNAENVIPLNDLCNLVKCLIENNNMRIPEIFIEPIGESDF